MNLAANTRAHHQRRRRLRIPAALAAALTLVALVSACVTRGRHFPSLVVDGYRRYSVVELPTWERPTPTPEAGASAGARPAPDALREYHRLVAVEGVPLRGSGPPWALQAELAGRLAQVPVGAPVSLRFEDPEANSREVVAPVRRFGLEELLFLFVMYALAAWLVLWSGGLVFTIGGREAARGAYAFWSVVTFVFLVTFFDYHTNAWLVSLFSASTLGLVLSALWLAYSFPRPPRGGAPALQAGLIAVTGVGAVVALGLGAAPLAGWDPRLVRRAIDYLLLGGMTTLALTVLLRLRRSRGQDRIELLTAAWGLVSTPLALALVHASALATGRDMRHLLLPFFVLPFPLSIGYAMVRNNILEARVVLTPRMLLVPFALGAVFLAVLGAYLVYVAIQYAQDVLVVPVLLGLAIFGAMMGLARHVQVRLFFPATLAFRGTVEGLSDRLAALRDVAAIRQAVEEVVVKALPTLSARVLAPGALDTLRHLPAGALEQLRRGEHVWTVESPREQHLLIPMRSLGELQAALLVAPKREAALYTQEDLHLLETLAGLGALALHNAQVVQALETFRRLEVDAAREDKRLALSALSAEVCHEMVYPLNFLRDLLRHGASGHALDEEDLAFAREEIGRMDRMIHSLRELELPAPRTAPLPLLGAVQRALLLLREPLQSRRLSVSVDVAPEVTVAAEGDALVQLLSNLLRNAAQATPDGGAIGVRARVEPPAQYIEVWDTGPGISSDVAQALFTRRITTRPDGYGIGLSVVHRIARSFHWEISFGREADRTFFRITLPPVTGDPA